MRKVKFKVVKQKNRVSAIVNGKSKYAIKYIPNQNVYAPENTMGIFVFTTRYAAEDWMYDWIRILRSYPHLIVIRVLPIGKGQTVRLVSSNISSEGLDRYYNQLNHFSTFAPEYTMVYPGVHVID